MSNTNVSQTKAMYFRREVMCKTWRKYSLWKFQGVCEPKVSSWIRAGSCTFWEAVFQLRIILWFGLVKRSLFHNESQSAGFRVQGQSPILSRMCHQAACGVQRNCPLHFEDVNFQPTQTNGLNLTSYIQDRRWEDKIASNEQAASHLFRVGMVSKPGRLFYGESWLMTHAFEARFIRAKEFIVVFIFCDVCFLCTWPKTLIRFLLDFLVRFSRAFCTCRAT